jgi:hypothetical protein
VLQAAYGYRIQGIRGPLPAFISLRYDVVQSETNFLDCSMNRFPTIFDAAVRQLSGAGMAVGMDCGFMDLAILSGARGVFRTARPPVARLAGRPAAI